MRHIFIADIAGENVLTHSLEWRPVDMAIANPIATDLVRFERNDIAEMFCLGACIRKLWCRPISVEVERA